MWDFMVGYHTCHVDSRVCRHIDDLRGFAAMSYHFTWLAVTGMRITWSFGLLSIAFTDDIMTYHMHGTSKFWPQCMLAQGGYTTPPYLTRPGIHHWIVGQATPRQHCQGLSKYGVLPKMSSSIWSMQWSNFFSKCYVILPITKSAHIVGIGCKCQDAQ